MYKFIVELCDEKNTADEIRYKNKKHCVGLEELINNLDAYKQVYNPFSLFYNEYIGFCEFSNEIVANLKTGFKPPPTMDNRSINIKTQYAIIISCISYT